MSEYGVVVCGSVNATKRVYSPVASNGSNDGSSTTKALTCHSRDADRNTLGHIARTPVDHTVSAPNRSGDQYSPSGPSRTTRKSAVSGYAGSRTSRSIEIESPETE